jgi:anti-sigma B factor antagonist
MDIPEAPPLDLQRFQRDGATVLTLAGDVDARGAPIVRDSLVDTIESTGGLIVLDLTHVPYMDSMGLGTLVSALKRANERGVRLRFVITGTQILKVLNITGLIRVFAIYPSVDEALQDPI